MDWQWNFFLLPRESYSFPVLGSGRYNLKNDMCRRLLIGIGIHCSTMIPRVFHRLSFFALLLGLIACGTKTMHGQGNLQFNQVLFLETAQASNVLLGTVPANKVWKITAAGTTASSYFNCGFSFNGQNQAAVVVGNLALYNDSYRRVNSIDNIWLPAGTPVTALNCGYYRWLSIIEFNILP